LQARYRADDAQIAQTLLQRLPASIPVIHVWNKADAVSPGAAPEDIKQADLRLSAKTGEGLASLRQKLLEVVGWQTATEGIFMARERHVQALREVDGYLQQAAAQLDARQPALDLLAEDLRKAQRALGQITGEFTPDDLLGEIFSKFCIGK
jgi:tRNA modification GTPase